MGIVHKSWLLKFKDQVWQSFYKTANKINNALIQTEGLDKEIWELCNKLNSF